MDFTEIVIKMWPCWAMAFFVIFATYNSEYKSLLRIQKRQLAIWVAFLVFLLIFRVIKFKFFSSYETLEKNEAIFQMISWKSCLFVFWEDICHGLPLLLLRRMIGTRKWLKPLYYIALLLVMISFGTGHLYQGWKAALMISFYIPFTVNKGEEVGFGTIVACHTLYDLTTWLSVFLSGIL